MTTRFASILSLFVAVGLAYNCQITMAATFYDEDVTPDFIDGTDNPNGSFTVDRENGIEIGLRAKLRHDANGDPQAIYNSNGDGTYTFMAGVAPTQSSDTAVWSFEWSINTDFEGTEDRKLEDLSYLLTLADSTGTLAQFDPIKGPNPGESGAVFWDHAFGDNTTGNGGGVSVGAGDGASEYAALLADYNVAQNSWKPHWVIPGFDPNKLEEYTITLDALDSPGGNVLASSSITVNAVPEPGTIALAGLAGLFGTVVYLRRRWA